MNRPKMLDPTKWDALMQLDEVMEAIQTQGGLLETHAENPGACPAVAGYAEEFDTLIDVIQKLLDELTKQVEPLVGDMLVALEQFRQTRLNAMANCSKPTCPDKERAQQEMGWIGGDQILQ